MRKILLPPVYFVLCLNLAFAVHSLWPIATLITPPVTYLGAIVIAIALVDIRWTQGLFRRERTTNIPFGKPSTLVTVGPYRFSRNPMYLGFVAIMLGVAILLGSLSAFVAPIALGVVLDFQFIRREEQALEATFGPAFLDYKHHVRRWL